MDHVQQEFCTFNELRWTDGDHDISVEILTDGLRISLFYFGDYADDPGGRNVYVEPVFISWAEIHQMREKVE